MAAESLSPVELNSKTRATGPLQCRHLAEVKKFQCVVMVAVFFLFFLVYCVFLSLNPVHLKEKLQALSSKQGL